MTAELFFDYLKSTFYPFLVENGVQFPVVLFVDGHASHLTLKTSEFCRDHNIVLVAFIPNATHLLQPADVGVFHPVKSNWRKCVAEYLQSTGGRRLDRVSFCLALNGVSNQGIFGNLLVYYLFIVY